MNISARKTVQKKLIREALEFLHHPDAEQVYDYVRRHCDTISKATVYRNLNQMADDGEIARVYVLGKTQHYDWNTKKHYHFRCESCGRLYDSEAFYDQNLNMTVKFPEGFLVASHDIIFSGLCPECR